MIRILKGAPIGALFLTLPLLFFSCNKEVEEKNLTPEQIAKNKLIARGKAVYMSECIACHNPNPKQPGSIGPDVYGSSEELLTARMMRLEYPPGYKPKRNTTQMAEMDHLEKDIPAIHAFLNN